MDHQPGFGKIPLSTETPFMGCNCSMSAEDVGEKPGAIYSLNHYMY